MSQNAFVIFSRCAGSTRGVDVDYRSMSRSARYHIYQIVTIFSRGEPMSLSRPFSLLQLPCFDGEIFNYFFFVFRNSYPR